ncbi:gamma carbonic anhydrase family protein [Aureibacillus halotolerans]|uniref:Carbonic anhydrase/acetyltransferase-like protein (Isoleucine patch superfamily) n=1 Tax=Aureibacillus halotolerans TaxID=1508390 RepID=A0A4R6U611_9BACI|nr:gamma carbonic anhydrase family protein [Aureibacillus halotolerans]TDQ40293.1 carbonic anhydrase/acetyltransferase-like protein (isoleucine patch superfamily) [Aureibacillus halotolerans]
MIYPYLHYTPKIDASSFIAANATVTGHVTLLEETSVWFQAVIRGDVAPVIIGKRSNIQDGAVLHQSPGLPVIIEEDVTVGHQALLHSAIVRKGALVGMGATMLDGAELQEGAMLGAGSLLTGGKTIPPYTLALGSPAKPIRALTQAEIDDMKRICEDYVKKGKVYKQMTS